MIHHPQNERCTLVPQLVYCLDYFKIRKGCQKKTFMFFYYTGGMGVGWALGSVRVVKKPHWFVKEKLFQRACRIILGPQKHVLHLVWISFVIYILYIIFRVNSSILVLMDLIWFYDIRGDKLYNGVETQFVMISRQFKFWSRKLVSLSYFSPKSKNFFSRKNLLIQFYELV